MSEYSVFDLIGPQMTGPSSSHTAGAARIGGAAFRMAGGRIKKARVIVLRKIISGHCTSMRQENFRFRRMRKRA